MATKKKKVKLKELPKEMTLELTKDAVGTKHDATWKLSKSPVRDYKRVSVDSNDPGYINRLLIATPTKGIIRMEWAQARHGATIPVNWSQVQYIQYMHTFSPIRFSVANAQNVIVKTVIEKDFEWLLLIEDDVIIPPDAFVKFNQYIREEKHPIVSGIYYTKSEPPEPLLFRGRGTSYYGNWKRGDKVWVDGVPTGVLLIHAGVLRAMWNESPEYVVNNVVTRRVFDDPRKLWYDPNTGSYNAITGTSDLDWCTRVMEGKFLEKAGWKKHQKKKYPFLVDTSIWCEHIDLKSGVTYPKVKVPQNK